MNPAFKHTWHLNIQQSAHLSWAWEPGQCYQRADPTPESPQASTCSLPTPWVTLPRTHTPELPVLHFWFVCFFQAQFAFQPLNWRECHREECRCILCSFQPKYNSRSLELLVPGTGLAVSRLVPSGDTQDISHGTRGLPRAGQWTSLELILEQKPGWAGCLLLDGNGKWG